jgi:TolB-like protein/cytochrome c-type biogenesis protein CcmH/NrfG
MGKRLDRVILVFLALALGYFAFDKFVLDPARDAQELATAMEQAREEGRTEAEEEVRDASIAVLAFQDLSPGGDQEYFGDGLAVDLINQLADVPELRVTGKTSAFSFKGTDATIPEIGEALNVAHVLDGSVSKSGDRVRISVQLMDARQDKLLWSETYDRPLGDIFDIRDEITLTVYDGLTIELERLEQASLRTDPEVYDLTLKARSIFQRPESVEDDKRAAELLAQALAIDPDYVPALLLSIRVNYMLLDSGLISDDEEERLAIEMIDRVLAIDPNNGQALGHLAWDDYELRMDLESAARRFSDALRTAPGDLELARFAGMFARSVGRHAESIALLERCVAADPENENCTWQLTRSYLWGNRLGEALKTYRRFEALRGTGGEYYLILTLLLQGHPARALGELQSVSEERQESPYLLAARAMTMHDLGRYEESEVALQKIVGQVNASSRGHAYLVAEAHAWIGQIDSAFKWLEKAYALDERHGMQGHWFQQIMFLPIWRNLHDDPRWNDLRERMNVSAARLDRLEFTIPPWISLSVE